MKRIRVKRVGNDPYVLDCVRIKGIFAKKGFDIHQEQARELWERFSESRSFGWMHPDSMGDAAIYDGLLPFWEEDLSSRSKRVIDYMSTLTDVRALWR